MANQLLWNDGEGYDIHVLRGMPASKRLDGSLALDPNGGPVSFDAHFTGAPSNANLGVTVNTSTGEVTAAAQNPASQPQLPNFNFLMTAKQSVGSVTSETVIRIHIHDSINKIWPTPKTITVHENTSAWFTVLALFGDDTVGDISEWPQLKYDVPSLSNVPVSGRGLSVLNTGDPFSGNTEPFGGRLLGRILPDDNPNPSFDVTVALKSSSPAVDQSGTATVSVKASWIDVAKDANTLVKWVAGPFTPNPNDFDSGKHDCIKSVFSRANILFISEGFKVEDDFRKKVLDLTVKELRTKPEHEPFKVLSNSINYWAVFVPSKDDGISILGENEIISTTRTKVAGAIPLPSAPTQPQWTIDNMIHEAGLPMPHDAPVASAAAWPASRKALFDIPATASVDAKALSDWNDLKQRTLLNERDTAFGIAHYDRPRASGQGRLAEERLLHNPRRINEAGIRDFVENLQFSGFPIGANWEKVKPDSGRVCFVCRSGRTGGTAIDAYFTASTGQAAGAGVTPSATAGMDIKPGDLGTSFSIPIYAATVSHECGHALKLGDEYGGNDKFDLNIHAIPFDPNLQADTLLVPLSSNFDKIKWLWPRVSKTGVLVAPPDFQGAANPVQFVVRLRPGDGKPFKKGDLVRIRESPVQRAVSADPYASILLQIDLPVSGDNISVSYVNPNGPHVNLTLYNPSKTYVFICTSIKPNTEFALVSPPVLTEIAKRNGPLNASAGQACVVGQGAIVMSPKDLKLSKPPPIKQDIIGLYEGGGYHDCGVVRPAGRCRMRSGFDYTIPFCHVCRYVIVDAIDPTKQGDLDTKLYDKVYPG